MGRYMTRRRLRRAVCGGLLCVVAVGAAGCSSETSRFGESPNSNPYAGRASSRQPAAAPIQPVAAPIQPTRTAAVESQPLPQAQSANSPYAPQYASLQYEQPQYYAPPPPQYAPPQPVPPQPVMPYAPPQSVPAYTPPPPQYAPPQSMTPYAPPAPRSASDFSGAPGGGARLAHAAAPRAPAAASLPAPPAHSAIPVSTSAGSSAQTLLPTPPVYTVASGDTLGRVAHRYRVSVREIAVANGIAPDTPLKVGTRLTIPVRTATLAGAQPGRTPPNAPVVAQTKPIIAPQ